MDLLKGQVTQMGHEIHGYYLDLEAKNKECEQERKLKEEQQVENRLLKKKIERLEKKRVPDTRDKEAQTEKEGGASKDQIEKRLDEHQILISETLKRLHLLQQPEMVVMHAPASLVVPANLQKSRLEACATLDLPDAYRVYKASIAGWAELETSGDSKRRNVTLQPMKPGDTVVPTKGEVKVKLIYNPKGDGKWEPYEPADFLGYLRFPEVGLAPPLHVTVKVTKTWAKPEKTKRQ